MPVYLVWILMVLFLSGVAGLGFTLGKGLGLLLATIGAGFIFSILWQPLIKPFIKRVSSK